MKQTLTRAGRQNGKQSLGIFCKRLLWNLYGRGKCINFGHPFPKTNRITGSLGTYWKDCTHCCQPKQCMSRMDIQGFHHKLIKAVQFWLCLENENKPGAQ